MKQFKIGLVVGKFAPLHLGHEKLISKAFEQCANVILLSWSCPEINGFPATLRERWLRERFPQAQIWVLSQDSVAKLRSQGIDLPDLPYNSAPDAEHRNFVAQFCIQVLKTPVHAVFTGEAYGDGFALHLENALSSWLKTPTPVRHIFVPRDMPISGTKVRSDIHRNRDNLSPKIYSYFVDKICFLGGESTGKSTLSSLLAKEYKTYSAPEYGRELWEKKKGQLIYEDLLTIAQEQVLREEKQLLKSHRFLFCDTSPLTTLFYCHEMFGRSERVLKQLALRSYAKTFLCFPDFPLVQDGTRKDEEFRQKQHRWYQNTLEEAGIPYVPLKGNLKERVIQTKAVLEHF